MGLYPPESKFEPVTASGVVRSQCGRLPTRRAVIDAASYTVVSRDPAGAPSLCPTPGGKVVARPGTISSGASLINYHMRVGRSRRKPSPGAGDAVNNVPASVRLMIERAIKFRAGSGVGDLTIGSLTIGLADSYKTDRIPAAITSIGRAWAYRPGLFSARP